MKIVINACYGGFGLSTEAMKRAVAEKAKGITTQLLSDYGALHEHLKDAGDGYTVGWIDDILFKDSLVYSYDDSVRTDPILIRIVEEMGEEANGHFAKLKVIEIPNDVKWEIAEYDGYEHVAEVHKTWE